MLTYSDVDMWYHLRHRLLTCFTFYSTNCEVSECNIWGFKAMGTWIPMSTWHRAFLLPDVFFQSRIPIKAAKCINIFYWLQTNDKNNTAGGKVARHCYKNCQKIRILRNLLLSILQMVENMLIKILIPAVASVELKQNSWGEGVGLLLFSFSELKILAQ